MNQWLGKRRAEGIGGTLALDTVCMAVPDDFGFSIAGCTECMYMDFFSLHHSGTQFFLGNIDIFFDPKIRQLHYPGG